jgi:ABC-type uncharacterized transport system substrate-binding protein
MGHFAPCTRALDGPRSEPLRRGLHDLGWIERQNIVIEGHGAEVQIEQIPDPAADLVQPQSEVIVTSSPPVVKAMKDTSSIIPIVLPSLGDSVGTQLMARPVHPGGNSNGVTDMAPEFAGKRLELLKQAVLERARLCAICNAGDPAMARQSISSVVLPGRLRPDGAFRQPTQSIEVEIALEIVLL